MWDKIKAFFNNKATKIVAWVILTLAIAVLILGGATKEAVSGSVVMVAAIIAAVAGLVAYITEQIKK